MSHGYATLYNHNVAYQFKADMSESANSWSKIYSVG